MADGVDILTLQERVRTTLSMSESHFREFKSAWEGSPGDKRPRDAKTVKRDVGETLVAFANADGGELLVGVEDDGAVTGVPHHERIVQSFLDAWRTHVHARTPLDRPLALQLEIDGQKVLYFSVEKGTSLVHLTQDGRCLQRKDRESVPVASEVINFERQERLSREYDRGFVDGADSTALHEEALTAAGRLVAPGLSSEKLLQLLGLAEYGAASLRLRRAALLLFAKDVSLWHPRCEVRVLRVSGTDLGTGREYNVVDDKHVVGNIAELLQSAWDELRPYLVETRLGPDGRFQAQVRYPEDACREALTNAIAHRDYTIEGRAIEVYVFDDRVEVRSPGALLSTVTVAGLRNLAGVHQSRNTAIARTLRELGYMREMGEGFRRMFQLMRAHDLVEPEVVAESQQFTVALRHRSVFSEEDQRWISAFEDFQLERDEDKVLLLGRHGESLSVQQIMDAVDIVDTEDYRALIERLLNKGLIRGLKATKSTGKQRRNSPRWAVVPPDQATDYLRELTSQVRAVVEGGRLKSADYGRVASNLRRVRARGRIARD
jgi:ATP-dependent DNA helicase RecG